MQQEVAGRRRDNVTANVLAGLAGGLVASFAMERFQRALGAMSHDVGGAPGGGGQQYRKPQSEPATYKAADAIAEAGTGYEVPMPYKPAAGSLVHYAFGGAMGAIYGAASARNPQLAAGAGLPFGAAVWIVADEIGVPLTGLSKPPTAYPLKDHASAFAAHLVYGVTTEGVRRLLVGVLDRSHRSV
jgi:putative membrane protein